jgi:hypothetical protein
MSAVASKAPDLTGLRIQDEQSSVRRQLHIGDFTEGEFWRSFESTNPEGFLERPRFKLIRRDIAVLNNDATRFECVDRPNPAAVAASEATI